MHVDKDSRGNDDLVDYSPHFPWWKQTRFTVLATTQPLLKLEFSAHKRLCYVHSGGLLMRKVAKNFRSFLAITSQKILAN